MSTHDTGGTPPSNIRNFPPRKPRYTAQDGEDFHDARQLVMMREALRRLSLMHIDLHALFREVVQHEEAWPFYSVRQIQNYIDKKDFDLLTHHGEFLMAAREAVRLEIKRNMVDLSKALLSYAGIALSATSGLDLREDTRELKRRESDLELIRDVIDQANPEEQATLSRVTRVTQHSLRTMFNLGSPFSDMGQSAISSLAAPAPKPSSHADDPTFVAPRRNHLHLAQHWLRVGAGELHLMKLDLLADYAAEDRSPVQASLFDGSLVQVTEPQRDFIEADAQSHRDLDKAGQTLHLALTA